MLSTVLGSSWAATSTASAAAAASAAGGVGAAAGWLGLGISAQEFSCFLAFWTIQVWWHGGAYILSHIQLPFMIHPELPHSVLRGRPSDLNCYERHGVDPLP